MRIPSRLALVASLLLAPLAALAQGMPVTSYPAASTFTGAEKFLCDQSGTRTCSPAQQMAYSIANGAVATTASKGLQRQLSGLQTDCLRGDGSSSPCPSGGSGGTAVATHPGYRSGFWYRQARIGGTTGTTVASLLAVPMVVDAAVTITGLEARVVTGSAGTNLRYGIYTNNAGVPGTLVAGSDVTASTATSASNATATFASPISLSQGFYWIATMPDTAGASVLGVTASDAQANTMVGAADGAVPSSAVAYQATTNPGYAGGMPSTFPAGTPSTATAALLWFKAQ